MARSALQTALDIAAEHRARIAALEAQNAALDIAAEHRARITALEAENAALREIASELDDALGEDDEYPDETPMTLKYGRTTYYSLSLGLLRRARALLRGQGGGDA